jgi:hypothetical protein
MPNGTNAFPYWFSGNGRYFLYAPDAMTAPPAPNEPLYVYDFQAQSSESLGMARFVTPSGDGHFVAYQAADGKVAVWSDATGAATEFEAMANAYGSQLTLSPDGQKVLFIDTNQDVHVLVLGASASAIVARAVTCPGQTLVQQVGEAIFSADSSTVGALANVASPCNGAISPQAVHIFDIASSTDQSLTLPVGTESASGGMLAVSASSFVYDDVDSPNVVHVWSPTLGNVSIPADPSGGLTTYAVLSDDGNRLAFALDEAAGMQPMTLWDRTLGVQVLSMFVNGTNTPFTAKLNPHSGVALGYDAVSQGWVISKPGAAPTVWMHGANAHVASASDTTYAMSGTLDGQSGVFAFTFASGATSYLEGGQALTASDTHVYFIAADGLCEIAGP